jgi:ABC-2 type transport system ATP-binding protein
MHNGRILALGSPEEVKQLMKGTILEIRSSHPRRVTALLRGHFDSDSVGLFGDRVHLVTRDPDRDSERAQKIVGGAGMQVLGIRPIDPSLEDVFISVVAEDKEEFVHGHR